MLKSQGRRCRSVVRGCYHLKLSRSLFEILQPISRKIRAETTRAAASTRGISTASARAGCVPRRDAPFQNHIPKAASKIGSTAAVGAGSPAQWETRKVVRGAVGSNATSRRRISEATNCKVRSPASSPRRHIDVCPPSDVSLRGLLVHQHGHVAKPVLIAFRDGVAAGSAARAIAADASSLGALRDAQTR